MNEESLRLENFRRTKGKSGAWSRIFGEPSSRRELDLALLVDCSESSCRVGRDFFLSIILTKWWWWWGESPGKQKMLDSDPASIY